MIRCAAALTVLSLIVGGCTVGPDFKPPRPGMPAAFLPPTSQPTTHQSVVTDEAPPNLSRWWNGFDDAELNSLVARGIDRNIDVKLAESRIREARAIRGTAASSLFPRADSSGAYSRSGRSDVTQNLWQAGLDASWELDVFGGVRRSVEAADAGVNAAVEDRRDVLVTLISEVATDYMNLRASQRQLEVAYGNLDLQRHTADVTHRQRAVGFVSGLDQANADATVFTTEAEIPAVEASARQSIYAIALLLGLQPADLLDELSTHQRQPLVPLAVPGGLPSDLLRRRPDIRRAEALLHQTVADVGVATSDLYPKFNLVGSLEFSGKTIRRAASWDSNAFSFGPNFSWPIFDAGLIRSNIEERNALADQALLTYENTVLTALNESETALIAYEKEQQRRDALVKAVDANRKAVDYSAQLYQEGLTEFVNVLTAQRSLLSSENSLVISDQSIEVDLIRIYKALGGGWDPAEVEEPATTRPK